MRNPHLKKQTEEEWDIETLFKGIQAGDRLALGRAITLIESRAAKHQDLAAELLENCIPFSGRAKRIGITGSPGVGKSSWIEQWGLWLIDQGRTPAVLAIDPSSSISKGSLLGDKTRMTQLSHHPKAFIRPSPASDTLGGVAHTTKESIILCEAAGYDTILIETVGVGQSETMVKQMVDFFLLLILPGAGDDLQGIKRGIVELADLVAVNKADGERVSLAKRTKKDFRNALHLFAHEEGSWMPSVILTSSVEQIGLEQSWDIIEEYYGQMEKNQKLKKIRAEQNEFWFENRLNALLQDWIRKAPRIKQLIEEKRLAVSSGQATSTAALRSIQKELTAMLKSLDI